jgi:hypothetical protein
MRTSLNSDPIGQMTERQRVDFYLFRSVLPAAAHESIAICLTSRRGIALRRLACAPTSSQL